MNHTQAFYSSVRGIVRLLSVLGLTIATSVFGQVVEGPIVRGPTGNYYQVILDSGITWENANVAAALREHNQTAGHLSTVTSAEEHQFVTALAAKFGLPFPSEVWIGGFQQAGAEEPAGGWIWVNNEGSIPGANVGPEYSAWSIGEPNNAGGEHYLAIAAYGDGGWNDEQNLASIKGYIVEYESGACINGIAELAIFVAYLNLANGISNALDAALNALDDLNQNNDQAACNSLTAFINHVVAQRGTKISTVDADILISKAQAIKTCIGC